MTLWCIFRSPLMMGGDLPHNDPATTALLTNDEVLAVDQHATDSRSILHSADASVWTAKVANGKANGRDRYVAIFNTSDHPQELSYTWKQLGWSPGKYVLRDLWEHTESHPADRITVRLASHACVLYRVNLRD
jgi:alpha-galactosidase